MTMFFRQIFTTFIVMMISVISITTPPQHVYAATPKIDSPTTQAFMQILLGNNTQVKAGLEYITDNWSISLTPMILETIYLSRSRSNTSKLIKILEHKTRQSFGYDLDKWYIWIWNQDYKMHPDYPAFKSVAYRLIDSRFAEYFDKSRENLIRLDEVRWGGVKQDGIPPLRNPRMISAKSAEYLKDDHVVFGVYINGAARAYPKRILAWHEMFVDDVGGESVTGVYCTLCGSAILYKNTHNQTEYHLGTSGFLYRSNKLMYDRRTQSLWNTLWGQPVIGPLVGKDITLERLNIVTSTWGEWRRRHPHTKVLSLETGHRRDYSEGAAYRQYFETDELMFQVPVIDSRLDNKAEILGLRLAEAPEQPIAFSSEFLSNNPVYMDSVQDSNFVVFTDSSGAHRVYDRKNYKFKRWDQSFSIVDQQGQTWTLHEDYIESDNGVRLSRLPSHNAFWFGWYAAYKNTRLIK